MEVLVKDFNCIKTVKMDFQPGFNVIQGPSNSGKSSVIKAIEKCIFNQSGSTNVRHGADNLLVGIRYKGREVYLTKGKNTKYKVDNEIFEKIGVNQLEQVATALNIKEVVLGGEKVRLNFSSQFSYPFLLDKTPGQLYKFIVDSAESESLSDVLKDMAKDIKDLDKSIIQNEAQIDILNKQKASLENKLVDADSILDVSNKILALDSTYTSINRESELRDKYTDDTASIGILRQRLETLTVDGDLVIKMDQLKESYVASRDTAQKYKNVFSVRQSLSDKLASSVSINTDSLDTLCKSYKTLQDIATRYYKVQEQFKDIENKIGELDIALDSEKEKLNKFNVCPLCGGELKC